MKAKAAAIQARSAPGATRQGKASRKRPKRSERSQTT